MSSYGQFFVEVPGLAVCGPEEKSAQTTDSMVTREGGGNPQDIVEEGNLVFVFAPDFSELLAQTAAPEGSDGWALNVGAVSVTPYLTSFAELPESERSFSCLQEREWKL